MQTWFWLCRVFLGATVVLLGGCYYAFDVSPATTRVPPPRRAPGAELVTYEEHAPRYLGNTVGESVDPKRYCAHPLRVDRRVEPIDLVASAAAGFLYQPETVHITCELPRQEDQGVAQ